MKKFLTILNLLFIALLGRADYIHWIVAEDSPEFYYAQLRIRDGVGEAVSSTSYVINYIPGYDISSEAVAGDSDYYGDIGTDYIGKSFVVELFNESDEITHVSEIYDFSDVIGHVSVKDWSAGWEYVPIFRVSNFTSIEDVPEPSCAFLLMIGVALFGVRRKPGVCA